MKNLELWMSAAGPCHKKLWNRAKELADVKV
jgi:hypothetical protein